MTIKGSRQDVAEAALRQSAEIFYASHNWQPFFVEGIKTLAYELWEQLGFAAPDNVVVPLGYGSNVLGADIGFAELQRRGEIAKRPRLFGVQAARCAPYAAAFQAGAEGLVPTEIASTIAEGIATAKPTRVGEVLRAVRDSGGSIVAVEEAEIIECAARSCRPGPLRRAHLRGRRGRPEPAAAEWRHPAARAHGPGADRLRPQGLGHHR